MTTMPFETSESTGLESGRTVYLRTIGVRVGLPVLATALAAVVNVLLWPEFGFRYPLIGFYPAIVITALIGGLWPGIICTVVSSCIAAIAWFDPRFPTPTSRAADAVALMVFVTIGSVISLLTDISAKRTERERIARSRAEAAERELATEVADLRGLQQLTESVFRRDDPAEILRDLLRTAVEFLGIRLALVHLYDASSNTLNLIAHIGLTSDTVDRIETIRVGTGAIAAAFAQRQRLTIPRDGTDGVSDGTGLATPMITAEGKALGVLTTDAHGPDPLPDRRLRFLDACVQQTAQALERGRLLQRERAARRDAEEASHVKDAFLSTVSHELRTPLNAVLGWAEMLRAGHLSNAARERALDAICDNAHRQVQLIGDLLDVSRITAGTLRIQPTSIDLLAVVRQAIDVVEPAAKAKNLTIVVEGAPLICRGDAGRLQQVFWNVLTNAVKFTPTDGVIHVAVHQRDRVAEIRVRDTGRGIPASFLPFVFDPFRQADPSTTRPQGGLGLGLSIVKQLVEAHGGTISAESGGDGRGAVFTIRLPALTNESTAPVVSNRPNPGVAPPPPTLTGTAVLLVDDDADSREVTAMALSQAGAVVRVAGSTREALEMLNRTGVHIILADIAMPEQDGYAFIRCVRGSASPAIAQLPAIAVTSLVQEADRQKALAAGYQLHVAKPITPHQLTGTIAEMVHHWDSSEPV
jgi:signal transduction histidine kinase/ActR/RegA family two-component response regulator